MKPIRQIVVTALLTITIFSTITYVSCQADACASIVCLNSGTCADGICTCPSGYEGTTCETLSRVKFLGTYVGSGSCGASVYSINIVANADSLEFNLSNLDGRGTPVICTMTGTNTFSFTGTSSTNTYAGTGTLTDNQLSIPYQITSRSTGAVTPCSFTGTK